GKGALFDGFEKSLRVDHFQMFEGVIEHFGGPAIDHSSGFVFNFSSEILGAVENVLGVLDTHPSVLKQRSMHGLGCHSEELNRLTCQYADKVEHCVHEMAVEDVTTFMAC